MPTVKVLIPTPLRKFTGNADTVSVDADSIGAMLNALIAAHAPLGKSLLDDEGKIRRFVNVYLNGEDIRFLQDKETALKDGDEVSIVPAVAGGVTGGTETYNLTFTRAMHNKPILFEIGKRFRVTTTLRRAILNEEGGWAEIAVSGTSDEIGRAMAELQTTGVSVTGPLAELVDRVLAHHAAEQSGDDEDERREHQGEPRSQADTGEQPHYAAGPGAAARVPSFSPARQGKCQLQIRSVRYGWFAILPQWRGMGHANENANAAPPGAWMSARQGGERPGTQRSVGSTPRDLDEASDLRLSPVARPGRQTALRAWATLVTGASSSAEKLGSPEDGSRII